MTRRFFVCAVIRATVRLVFDNILKMKKLILVTVLIPLLLCACGNKKANPETEVPKVDPRIQEQMDKQAKDRADWDNWNSLSDERKAELLDSQKAIYDDMKAKKAERQARREKFEAAMNNWDNLSLDERKAAFDLIANPSPKQQTAADTSAKEK